MSQPGGIICPIATPLDADEGLDVPALHLLLDRILPDLDGVFALGSSGEFALLRPRVSEELVERVVERVAGAVPVYVGVGDTGTSRAVANLHRLDRPGIDYVVACTSFYYPITDQKALIGHFLALAEASPRPVIIYNIPQNTFSPLDPEAIRELVEHPNVAGIKDSAGDMFAFQQFLELRTPDFSVMQGREQLAASSLWLGADGLISALSNLDPGLLRELRRAVQNQQRDVALAVQRRVTKLAQLFDQGYWLSALKAAIAELGIGSGTLAQPIPACDARQRRAIREHLVQAGLL